MSDLLENKLDEVEIMNLLIKLSDVKVKEALKDLTNALNDSIDLRLPNETELVEIQKTLKAIDQKIETEAFQINKSDPNDQQICRTFVDTSHKNY